MGATEPLIVALLLDRAAQERFDALRRTHFPAHRNHLAAHVTLFHALPGEQVERVAADLAQAAARPSYDVEVVGVRFLGRGVAFDLRSPELGEVRAQLVTEQARARQTELEPRFTPFAVRAEGLVLWCYPGGPWELVASFCADPGAA